VRLGIFGGTFDPPHVGHLLVAVDAVEHLSLDRLVFVPTASQPLKLGAVRATATQRLAMVRLLVGDDARFAVDSIEIERSGLSYSVDTLAEYARREPDAERFFLVGADVVRTFDKWREPARVLSLAKMVVLTRDDDAVAIPDGAAPLRSRRVDVSSTEIRARVAARQSLRGFVPDPVAAYIADERLYR
jgi:nicotinate-nucleotide adenylyltransferase